MTDNVPLTPGSGTLIAADEVVDGVLGTVEVQYVKLMSGALDSTAKIGGSADGLYTQGSVAHDAAVAANPLLVGGRASAAAPTSVDADGDAVRAWFLRNGAQAVVVTAGGALIGGDANGLYAQGNVASDSPVSANPSLMGARASSAVPGIVSADGDAVALRANRRGALVVVGQDDAGVAKSTDTFPIYIGGYAATTLATHASADGQLAPLALDRQGVVYTRLTAAGALVGGDATNGLDVDVTRLAGIVTNTLLGDATANPTTAHVGAFLMNYDGAGSWLRSRNTAGVAGSGDILPLSGVLAAGVGPGYDLRKNPANLATAAASTSALDVNGAATFTAAINTTTTGTFIIEVTADNTNWVPAVGYDVATGILITGESLVPTAGKVYRFATAGLRQLRLRTVTTLGATMAHFFTGSLGDCVIPDVDPTGQVHKSFNATTTQTGTDVWTPASGKKIAVTSVIIGTYGTTAARVILWFGDNADTTFTEGTDQALVKASFAPSASSKPGLVYTPAKPIFCTTADRELHITTDAGISIDVIVEGYEW